MIRCQQRNQLVCRGPCPDVAILEARKVLRNQRDSRPGLWQRGTRQYIPLAEATGDKWHNFIENVASDTCLECCRKTGELAMEELDTGRVAH